MANMEKNVLRRCETKKEQTADTSLTLIDWHTCQRMFSNSTTATQSKIRCADDFAATKGLPIVSIELLHAVIAIWHDTVECDGLCQELAKEKRKTQN